MARIAIIALLLLATAPALAEPAQPDAPPPASATGAAVPPPIPPPPAAAAPAEQNAAPRRRPPRLRHRTRICANPCA